MTKIQNPLKELTKREAWIWILSLISVTISNLLSGEFSLLSLLTALIGVTAVLYQAKGSLWGQIFVTMFSLLYSIISLEFHYYGEMITYLGMAFPMALWAIYTWMKNPSEQNQAEVKIRRLNTVHKIAVTVLCAMVTIALYFILRAFDTPNLIFSTISITTSFFAAALTMLRSTYYAFWYAMNDLVLIILWTLASIKEPSYVPMVANFLVFFLNDLYGFISWKKREIKQLSQVKNEGC